MCLFVCIVNIRFFYRLLCTFSPPGLTIKRRGTRVPTRTRTEGKGKMSEMKILNCEDCARLRREQAIVDAWVENGGPILMRDLIRAWTSTCRHNLTTDCPYCRECEGGK